MKKKIITLILTMVLFALQVMPVYAAGEGATLSSGRAAAGETVQLTVTINESVTANTIGISFSNSSEVEVTDVSWDLAGDVDAFDSHEAKAVWSRFETGSLSGRVATLTYRIKGDATAGNKNVNATVTYKDGDTVVRTDFLSSRITVIVNSGIEGAVKLAAVPAGTTAKISLFIGGQAEPVASAEDVEFVAAQGGGFKAAYRFDNIPSGSYLLRVSATGCISKDVRVSIGGAISEEDVELTRIGDANADGKVDILDLEMVAGHVARLADITDSYIIKVVDIDENGEINSKDITEIAKILD